MYVNFFIFTYKLDLNYMYIEMTRKPKIIMRNGKKNTCPLSNMLRHAKETKVKMELIMEKKNPQKSVLHMPKTCNHSYVIF